MSSISKDHSTILSTIFDHVESLQSFVNRIQFQHPHSQPERHEAIKRQKTMTTSDNSIVMSENNNNANFAPLVSTKNQSNNRKRKSTVIEENNQIENESNNNNNNNNVIDLEINVPERQKKDYFRPFKKQKEKHEKTQTYPEFLKTTLICKFNSDPNLPLNIPVEHTQSQRDVVARLIQTIVPQFWKNPILRDHVLAKGFQKTVKKEKTINRNSLFWKKKKKTKKETEA